MMAELFGQAGNREISLSANFLAGTLPTGKLGMGWNLMQEAIAEKFQFLKSR